MASFFQQFFLKIDWRSIQSYDTFAGFLSLFVGVALLIWNEKCIMQEEQATNDAINGVQTLNVFDRVRPEFEGHLVHIVGRILIAEPLTVPEYGIALQAVKLKARFQTYQWVEYDEQSSTKDPHDHDADDDGDAVLVNSTNYYYVKEWRDKLVNSDLFHANKASTHPNPKSQPFRTQVTVSQLVQIGFLALCDELKAKFDEFSEVSGDGQPERTDIKLHHGIYYHCEDVWQPNIGDSRVQFYYAGLNEEMVTVVAMQKNGILVPFPIMFNVNNNGAHSKSTVLLRGGSHTVNEMFHLERYELSWMERLAGWTYRIFGTVLIYGALKTHWWCCFLELCHSRRIISRRRSDGVQQNGPSWSHTMNIALIVSTSVIGTVWAIYKPLVIVVVFFCCVAFLWKSVLYYY